MDEHKFEIIKALMEQLEGEMKPGADEFSERLGRPKPEVSVMSLEAEGGMEGESPEGEMSMGPEDELKERLLKLRG